MEKNKIIGAAILVAGIALIVYGLNLQDTLSFKIKDFFGKEDPTSTYSIFGGFVASVVGVVLLVLKGKS